MSQRRTIRVTIEKEITIELPDQKLTPEFLAEFSASMWPVESIHDVFKYAARMAARELTGYNHDFLGLLDNHNSTWPRVPDVKVWLHDESYEEEVIAAQLIGDEGATL